MDISRDCSPLARGWSSICMEPRDILVRNDGRPPGPKVTGASWKGGIVEPAARSVSRRTRAERGGESWMEGRCKALSEKSLRHRIAAVPACSFVQRPQSGPKLPYTGGKPWPAYSRRLATPLGPLAQIRSSRPWVHRGERPGQWIESSTSRSPTACAAEPGNCHRGACLTPVSQIGACPG